MKQFELVADVANINDSERAKMLIMKLDLADDRIWCTERFGSKERSWERVKEIFLNKFTPIGQTQMAINRIKKIKQYEEENVKRFIARFNSNLTSSQRSIKSTDDRDKEDFETGLHQDVYDELTRLKRNKNWLGAENIKLESIQELAEEAEKNILLLKNSHRRPSSVKEEDHQKKTRKRVKRKIS